MFEGTIRIRKDQIEDVMMIFDVVIPNDYKVFVERYKLCKSEFSEGYYIEVVVADQKEWSKLKRCYFKGCTNRNGRNLPGNLNLRDF